MRLSNIFNKQDFSKNYFILENIDDLANFFSFRYKEKIIEKDLTKIVNLEDINNRKELDSRVLSIIARNVEKGIFLDLGTYKGRSAARMAINSPKSSIFTVNIHPKDETDPGIFFTDRLTTKEIGSFYKKHKLKNIEQIFANTANWEMPSKLKKLSLSYIDASHDTNFVFNDIKNVVSRTKKGGFVLFHDFSPIYRKNHNWIDSVMNGVELAIKNNIIRGPIFNVKHSWVGIWRKNW
jgi:hypothetical protein